jgi:hypothetical protein
MAWKPSYATLDQMRDWLRIRGEDDTDDDDLLTLKLGASSRAVDTATGRQFGKVASAQTRTYPLRWSRTLGRHVADMDDLMDLTGLAVTIEGVAGGADTTVDSDHYKLRPRNAVADLMAYTYIVISNSVPGCGCPAGYFSGGRNCLRELSMTAPWGWDAAIGGWDTYPEPVVEATLLQASRLNIRRDSPYGIAGGSDSGTEMRLLERLDPDIAPIIADYVRTGWVAR